MALVILWQGQKLLSSENKEPNTNELRLPVVGLVEELITGGSLCISGVLVALSEVEVGTASDDVDMARDLSWGDNGITTLNGQGRAVDGEELSVGTLKDGCSRGGHEDGLLGRHC